MDSGMKKALKIGGIGCGVLLLVGGLLVGLGVFRMATCCSDLEDLGETAEQAQLLGQDFADSLHTGDWNTAYSMLEDGAREEKSVEEFSAQLEQWRPHLQASPPFPIRLDLDIDEEEFDWSAIGDFNHWVVTTHFAAPRAEEILELRFIARPNRVDDETFEMAVIDWELRLLTRSLDSDPYARTARRFHDRIRRGEVASARGMIAMDADQVMDAGESTTAHIQTLVDQLANIDSSRVYALYPEDHPDVARVRMLLRDHAGDEYFMDYAVNWRDEVYRGSELIPADVDSDEIDEQPPLEDGEEVDEAAEESGEDVEADESGQELVDEGDEDAEEVDEP